MAVADGRNSLQNLDEYTLGRDLYDIGVKSPAIVP